MFVLSLKFNIPVTKTFHWKLYHISQKPTTFSISNHTIYTFTTVGPFLFCLFRKIFSLYKTKNWSFLPNISVYPFQQVNKVSSGAFQSHIKHFFIFCKTKGKSFPILRILLSPLIYKYLFQKSGHFLSHTFPVKTKITKA